MVKKQIDRMTTLVDDLFSMYAINSYEIANTVNIGKLILEIVNEQNPFVNEKSITISQTISDCHVKANAVMLHHAIANIISNAIKYNVEGCKVDIVLTENNNQVEILVIDTGIGISQQAALHIFEPFYREDKSRSRKVGGAGLGLSISQKIIKQHGGNIYYKNNKQHGSTFIIELPIK